MPHRQEPAESSRILEGPRALWALLPSLVMVALTLLPSVAARGPLRVHVWVAAALCAGLVVLSPRRRPLEVSTVVRRPHYMQAITQAGVFVAWGLYWEPVAGFVGVVLLQVAFAYQMDALLSWHKGRPWTLGFGPLPIVLSINLFMWFRDEYFGWQLVMIALCYLAKHVIVWKRDGRLRHVFNPSSFGLAMISFGLLLSGTSDITYGREIALTQESAPYFIHALFALGLIVQLQFGVVLVTASAAITTWLLGLVFLQLTGVYMFSTTDIPAAVFLGMLLLVTDPATSPRSPTAKVLFGAAYGALAFASYPLLEAMGSLGYYDKLLPVPLLNLLVRRFEGWGTTLGRGWSFERTPVSTKRNLMHVAAWAGMFTGLMLTHAVGKGHPGRDILFWHQACVDQRFEACNTYFKLLDAECDAGRGEACHNLGVELLERAQKGQQIEGRDPADYLERACDGGVELSCGLMAQLSQSGPPAPPPGATPSAPVDPLLALDHACQQGTAMACDQLADLHVRGARGATRDEAKAREYYQRGCDLGEVRSCSSFAALMMQAGDGDTDMAKQAFEKACELGDGTGCANLAGMYLMGQGVERDPARAAELNDQACGLGLGVACARLAQAHARGQGVEVDIGRAKELALRACEQGFAPACPPPGG